MKLLSIVGIIIYLTKYEYYQEINIVNQTPNSSDSSEFAVSQANAEDKMDIPSNSLTYHTFSNCDLGI